MRDLSRNEFAILGLLSICRSKMEATIYVASVLRMRYETAIVALGRLERMSLVETPDDGSNWRLKEPVPPERIIEDVGDIRADDLRLGYEFETTAEFREFYGCSAEEVAYYWSDDEDDAGCRTAGGVPCLT